MLTSMQMQVKQIEKQACEVTSQTNFDFLTSHFWRKILTSFERYSYTELKFEKIFQLWCIFVRLRGFKDCHFDQFGTTNMIYFALLTRKRKFNPS